MKFDIATLSVIISGAVALGALVISPVTALIVDWLKWRRENKSKESEVFTKSTVDLVTRLNYFRQNANYTEGIGQNKFLVIYGELLKEYFSWERLGWNHCNKKEKELVLEFRKKVLNSPHSIKELLPELTNEILDLSSSVGQRI
jgi:hypothetical protein